MNRVPAHRPAHHRDAQVLPRRPRVLPPLGAARACRVPRRDGRLKRVFNLSQLRAPQPLDRVSEGFTMERHIGVRAWRRGSAARRKR
jgi:hypothetical protein